MDINTDLPGIKKQISDSEKRSKDIISGTEGFVEDDPRFRTIESLPDAGRYISGQGDPSSLANQLLQQREIRRFEKRMPNLQSQLSGDLLAEGKRSIARQQAMAKQNMARRGLLFGGAKDKAMADIESGTAGQVAESTSKVKGALDAQYESMKDTLNQMKLQKWQSDVEQADAAYNRALKEYQSQLELIGSVGRAGGTVAGAIAGRK